MANNLRNYDETYKILRNVANPVMFINGFPLNLALIYCVGGIFIPIILILILKVIGLSIYAVIAIAICISGTTIVGVKIFYKRYGINGFQLQNRDRQLPEKIEGDMSLQSILKEKIKKL